MPRLYNKRFDGKVYEVQNRPQTGTDDVVVMQALTTHQVDVVKDMKKGGCSDTQIWRALHPEDGLEKTDLAKTGSFKLKLEQLTKSQLVLLIQHTIKSPVDSMHNMTREDLIQLIRCFGKGDKPPRVTLSR
jgi:hypothetical protein